MAIEFHDSVKTRLICFAAMISLLAAGVCARALHVQIMGDPRLERLAARQGQSFVSVRPKRGVIIDRNGKPLAVNVETQSLAFTESKEARNGPPQDRVDRYALARTLSKALGMGFRPLLQKLHAAKGFVWIQRHLTEGQIEALKKARLTNGFGEMAPGITLIKENKRVYPNAEVAAHVLGTVNIDSDGLEGAELWFNSRLRGKDNSFMEKKDALGRPTFIDAAAAAKIKEGEPLQLTLDSALQFEVENALRAAVQRARARSGSVIVMEAVTGEVLALANQPAFDPNTRGVPPANRRNRVFTDGFEPGSTIKPLMMALGVQQGWKDTDRFDGGQGKFVLQGKTISEAESHEKFGWITLKRMIQVSSNVVAAKAALKLGAQNYIQGLQRLGFGAKSGSGFPGEISGWLPEAKRTRPLTVANMGFGQGLLVTPMQMLRGYAALANGGWLVRPTLVKGLETQLPEAPPKRVFSRHTVETLQESLLGVTGEGGTGGNANVEGYRIAGKTGTAQVVDPATKRYSTHRYISSFIGFAVGVEPKIVIFTSIDEPKGVYYASETAAPLFAEVYKTVATRFSIPSDPKLVLPKLADTSGKRETLDQIRTQAAMPSRTVSDREFMPSRKLASDTPAVVASQPSAEGKAPPPTVLRIPSLKGLSPREVMNVFGGHSVKLHFTGFGLVDRQNPPEGTVLRPGMPVYVRLGEP
ncbi:MAG: penicillin-binding transpeptidase domain-containing protein [Bacteriovoracia bacterium]